MQRWRSAWKLSYSIYSWKKCISGPRAGKRLCVFFKALTLGDTRALTGSPAQPAPLSSTSHPGSTVTAARSPVGEHCLPSAEPGVQWVTTQAVRALSQQLSQVTKKVCGYLHAVFPNGFLFFSQDLVNED